MIYLDHHATTPTDPRVVAAMMPWFTTHVGNAGSRSHAGGLRASAAVAVAREHVANLIGAAPDELIFTSGATEANNLALLGALRDSPPERRHVLTCATEHRAVLDPLASLTADGFQVEALAPAPDGTLAVERVLASLRDDTALVSLMLANNEIGALHDLAPIAAAARARGILVHTDAVQAAGRLPVDAHALGVDLLTLSAHKLYGPMGVGALWISRHLPRRRLRPLVYGGGQEGGLRSGTLPVPLIVGFGAAADAARQALGDGEAERLTQLTERLWAALQTAGGVHLHGPKAPRLPGNLNLRFDGVPATSLLRACRGVAFSAGSACASTSPRPSHVLRALGLDDATAARGVRFGVGRATTEAEIDEAADRILTAVRQLRATGPVAPG